MVGLCLAKQKVSFGQGQGSLHLPTAALGPASEEEGMASPSEMGLGMRMLQSMSRHPLLPVPQSPHVPLAPGLCSCCLYFLVLSSSNSHFMQQLTATTCRKPSQTAAAWVYHTPIHHHSTSTSHWHSKRKDDGAAQDQTPKQNCLGSGSHLVTFELGDTGQVPLTLAA